MMDPDKVSPENYSLGSFIFGNLCFFGSHGELHSLGRLFLVSSLVFFVDVILITLVFVVCLFGDLF
jgi:hypothetical protein